jgi:hypothetical protein
MRRRRMTLLAAVAGLGLVLGMGTGIRRGPDSGGPATQATVTRATAAQSKRWGRLGYDRSYKADLLEKLGTAPQLVVLGGSRAQRFDPSVIESLTGLSAFNFAVHNCRSADAYAISKYLFARSPDTKLHCLYAIQATTLVDAPMDQALLYDGRFSQWFSKELLAGQKRARGAPVSGHVPSADVYSPQGCILCNGYDRHRERGVTLDKSLRTYLTRMVPRAASTSSAGESLSRLYFRKLLRLYNSRGVIPVLVIMPYHPEALSAFLAVGWQKKADSLKDYLLMLQRHYAFRVLDYTDISSFGGQPQWFYDGSHITKENAGLVLQQAVKQAPDCFR